MTVDTPEKKIRVLLVSVLSPEVENRDGVTKINHHLTVADPDGGVDWIALESTRTLVKKSHLAWLFSRLPYNVIAPNQLRTFAEKINVLAESYDVIHISSIELGALVGLLKVRARILFSAIDCHSLLFMRRAAVERHWLKRLVWRYEARRARLFERQLYRMVPKVHFVSQVDAEFARSFSPRMNAVVVGNGVDGNVFYPQNSVRQSAIVFVGNMGYGPNRDAARFLVDRVMPKLARTQPELRLWLVGKDLDPAAAGNIDVKGYVEDLGALLNKAKLFVAPIFYAAGVQNQILEALACGLPVLTTSWCMEGIEGNDSVSVLDSQDADAWVQAILTQIELGVAPAQRNSPFSNLYAWEGIRAAYRQVWSELVD